MVSDRTARRVALMIFLLMTAFVAYSNDDGPEVLDYEITAVKGKLLRETPQPETRLEVGDVEKSGALLRTGWRSAAKLQEATRGARFELGTRTRFRLAGDRAGVLLVLEKGRLRAIFDKVNAEDSAGRIVTTPSAVLTVRGTDYGVEVDGSGNTTVVVFEGEVEVFDLDRQGPPASITAGNSCSIRRGRAPGEVTPHSMSPRDWDRGRLPTTMSHGTGPAGTSGAMQGGAQHQQGGAGAGQRHGGG